MILVLEECSNKKECYKKSHVLAVNSSKGSTIGLTILIILCLDLALIDMVLERDQGVRKINKKSKRPVIA